MNIHLRMRIDLSKLEPTVACASDPGNANWQGIGTREADRAYIGSYGGKTSDFLEFATSCGAGV
jgi:hypothetical protein